MEGGSQCGLVGRFRLDGGAKGGGRGGDESPELTAAASPTPTLTDDNASEGDLSDSAPTSPPPASASAWKPKQEANVGIAFATTTSLKKSRKGGMKAPPPNTE